jgi:hypothetical protein
MVLRSGLSLKNSRIPGETGSTCTNPAPSYQPREGGDTRGRETFSLLLVTTIRPRVSTSGARLCGWRLHSPDGPWPHQDHRPRISRHDGRQPVPWPPGGLSRPRPGDRSPALIKRARMRVILTR